MSREIKFRGRRLDNGEWVKGSLIEAVDGTFILETGNYRVLFEEPEYHHQGMGCGLEDRNITDRYDAMEHGWEKAMFRVAESYPDFIEVHPDSVAQFVKTSELGQDIYDGDLVETWRRVGRGWKKNTKNETVHFSDITCEWYPKDICNERVVVIGNTTDAPDLLDT